MFKVYDSDGKMFEVPAQRVRYLLSLGWTPWDPKSPPAMALSTLKETHDSSSGNTENENE